MNLLEFTQKFSDEKACEEHLIQLRWKEGFTCPKCNHSEALLVHATHRRDADRRVPLFECKQCHHQTSVTAGTIFLKTETPLYKLWFLAIYLVSNASVAFLRKHFSVTLASRTIQLGTCSTKSVTLWRNETPSINWRASFRSMTSTLAAKAKENADVVQHSRPWLWEFH